MSDLTNFFNGTNKFGMNVKFPEKTVKQIGKTAEHTTGQVFEPLFSYLEENENVFSGDVTHEINKIRAANFNTEILLQAADEKVNGPRPSFDAMF